MKLIRNIALSLIIMLMAVSATFAQEDDMTASAHVFEIAIREVVDAEGFTTLGAELETLLEETDGYVGSLEYAIFFSLAPEMAEGQMFSVSISEWESVAAYEATASLLDNPTGLAYLETINPVQTVLVEPFVKGEIITLADFPQAGEVFEVAVRDLASYEDPVDFLRSIRGFTDALGDVDGVLREYEWLSVDGQYFVGMTRYASAEAFQAASQNAELMSSPNTAYIFTEYPPQLAQMGFLSE